MNPLSFFDRHRRGLLPVAVLALGAYYLFVVLPLSRKAGSLEAPLAKSWQKLAVSIGQSNATSIDFLLITNQYHETRHALDALESARKKAVGRFELSLTMRSHIQAPFQLVEFEVQRSKLLEDLAARAAKQQTVLETNVLTSFADYTADVREPELLWAAIAFGDTLLSTAFQCHIATLHALDMPGPLTNAPPSATPRLAEIPLDLEFSANATNTARFLEILPWRAEEIRAAGVTDIAPDKPALFIDRLIIRKQSPEKPDEVRVALRVVGFVLRE